MICSCRGLRLAILGFAVLALFFGTAHAALRQDQLNFLLSLNTTYRFGDWTAEAPCDWAGISCCTAGDTDCDPDFDLITALNLSGRSLGGDINFGLSTLSAYPDVALDLSQNNFTSFSAISNLYAPGLSINIKNNLIGPFSMRNTTVKSLRISSPSLVSVRIENVNILEIFEVFGLNITEMIWINATGFAGTDGYYWGDETYIYDPTEWISLRNVTMIDVDFSLSTDNYMFFVADLVHFYAERLKVQKFTLYPGSNNVFGNFTLLSCPENMRWVEVGSAYRVANTIDTLTVKDCVVNYFRFEAVRGKKLHLENLDQLDDFNAGAHMIFPGMTHLDELFARNLNITLPYNAYGTIFSRFFESNPFITKFKRVHVENWPLLHVMRFGPTETIKLIGDFPDAEIINIQNCVDCPWIEEFVRVQGYQVMLELVVVNCGLRNAEWLEKPMMLKRGEVRYRIQNADISGNQIETLNLVLNATMATNNLVVLNNPLRRLRIVKGDNSNFAYMDSLITDGASEYFEVRDVTLENAPYLRMGRRGAVRRAQGKAPTVFNETTFIVKGTRVTEIDISGVNASGTFPSFLFRDMPGLKKLDISYNSFTGTVPADLWTLGPQLVDVRLSHNQFLGEFPSPDHQVQILKIAANNFWGLNPVPIATSIQPLYWDLQDNYFSGEFQTSTGYNPGSSIDISDNLLSCVDASSLGLLGIVGDFTRNLCVGGGIVQDYPQDLAGFSCPSAFPLLASPCRKFEMTRCSGSGCRQVGSVNLNIEIRGSMPRLRLLYSEFIVIVGNDTYDCLQPSEFISFFSNASLAQCKLTGGRYNSSGDVKVSVKILDVQIFKNSPTGHIIVPPSVLNPLKCTKNCQVALEASSLSFSVSGVDLPTNSDDVQRFYITQKAQTSKRAAPWMIDCKSKGTLSFNNGSSISCALPPVPLSMDNYGKEFLVSIDAFADVLVHDMETGIVPVAPAAATVVKPCTENCVRRGSSAKLNVVVYGSNLPKRTQDITALRVNVGTGIAPSGAQFICSNVPALAGITLKVSDQGSSLECEIDTSLLTESLSGAVSVDLVVWGAQTLLNQVPSGDVLQAGVDPIVSQGTSVGVAVGVSVAVIVVVLIAVILLLVLIRRRFSKFNIMQTVEMKELKSKLTDEELKTVLNIKASDISLVSQLGSGAFGTVWLANYLGKIVAVKKLSGSALSGQLAEFFREASLMLSIAKHKHIVHVFGMCQDISALSLVMELVSGGSLDKYLKETYSSGKTVPGPLLHSLLLGIASGCEHLAGSGIVHRDLAARNVLITSDLTPKISDFGMSRALGDSSKEGVTTTQIGPIRWMSPEALMQTYSEKSDVWAFGVICWECLTGQEPYTGMDLMQLAVKIRDEGYTLEEFIPAWCPEYIKSLMKWCWSKKPTDRPSFSQIVQFLNENAPAGAEKVQKVKALSRPLLKVNSKKSKVKIVESESSESSESGSESDSSSSRSEDEAKQKSRNRWTSGSVAVHKESVLRDSKKVKPQKPAQTYVDFIDNNAEDAVGEEDDKKEKLEV